ncbi:unnamed protein product, partial [Didymodactylos carnosus]
TPRNQLRPEDLNAFESDKFELGHIPSVPPSQNLCSNVKRCSSWNVLYSRFN